jgi:hypothetical protein
LASKLILGSEDLLHLTMIHYWLVQQVNVLLLRLRLGSETINSTMLSNYKVIPPSRSKFQKTSTFQSEIRKTTSFARNCKNPPILHKFGALIVRFSPINTIDIGPHCRCCRGKAELVHIYFWVIL